MAINWKQFKDLIFSRVQTILTTAQLINFESQTTWNWINEDAELNKIIEDAVGQLDPEFQQKILKCNHDYDHLSGNKQTVMILQNIVWLIINHFEYLFAAYWDSKNAQETLADFNNKWNERQQEQTAAEWEDWKAEQERLKNVLKNNNQDFTDLKQKFLRDWEHLKLSAFYNSNHKKPLNQKER